MLRVNDKHRDLLALLCSTMPHNIRSNLFRDLNMIYTHAIHDKDTQAEGAQNDFESIHFSYYNCYSRRVFMFIYVSCRY